MARKAWRGVDFFFPVKRTYVDIGIQYCFGVKTFLLDDPNLFLVRRELKVKGTNAQILLAIILRDGRVLSP